MKLSKTEQLVLDVIDKKKSIVFLWNKKYKKGSGCLRKASVERAIENLKNIGIIYRDPADLLLKRSLDLIELNEGFYR